MEMGCLPVYTVGPKEVMLSGSYVSGTVPLSYYPCQTVTGGLGSRGGGHATFMAAASAPQTFQSSVTESAVFLAVF